MSWAVTRAPARRRVADAARRRVDDLIAFDPGASQLLMALGVLAGVAGSLGVIYLFMQVSQVLWVHAPAGVVLQPAMVARLGAQHHGETLLAMLLGGIVGMMTAFAVVETKPRDLTITMALLPVPMLATTLLAVQFLHDRTLGILIMAVVMAAAIYAPKLSPWIGPRAFLFGLMLFIGYLFGFVSRGAITTGDIGWVAVILWVAVAVNFVLRLAIFMPLTRGALRRTIQGFFARSRGVIVCSAQLLQARDDRELARVRRRLHRRLARLNEAALIADGLLDGRAETAYDMHERLFQTELTVQNIGLIADALCDARLPDQVRAALRDCLVQARETRHELQLTSLASLRAFGEDPETIRTVPLTAGRILRLADSLVGWQLATRRWREVEPRTAAVTVPFETPVTLVFGNLPGSTLVSHSAAAPPGSLRARLGLDFPAQSAIRLGVAVVVAASIGSVLSDRRFYWAVLAVFVTYMATNTSGEQVTKAAERVAGTVVGILVGTVLANAIGHSTWSLAVALLALFFGIYFMRASYLLTALGITITVSQLYMQLGEYTNHLLVLRLEETAIGAAVAALAALLIFPIHARQATRVAASEYYARLGALLDALIRRLDGEPAGLTIASRGLDHASHALRSAALPLSRMPFRSDDIRHNLLLFAQGSHHARNLAAQLDAPSSLDDHVRKTAVCTLRRQRRLVDALEHHVGQSTVADGHAFTHDGANDGHEHGTLTEELRRAGDLLAVSLDHGGTRKERPLLRDIARLDETLAELGDNLLQCDWSGHVGSAQQFA